MAYKENRPYTVYAGSSMNKKTQYRMQYKQQPQIRLQGDWLEELGFHAGTKMNVHCEEGKLTLTVLDDGDDKNN